MNIKIKNKKIILLVVILLSILLITVVFMLKKSNLDKQMQESVKKEVTAETNVTYQIKSINNDDIGILVTIENQSGIDEVKQDSSNQIIYGNNKTSIALDYNVKNDEEIAYKILDGNGIETSKTIKIEPYKIYYIEDLKNMEFKSSSYTIERDLDFKDRNSYKTEKSYEYYTEDSNRDGFPDNPFQIKANQDQKFEIEGNGKTINNYAIDSSYYGGLISQCNSIRVKNLLIKNANIESTTYAGILVGEVWGGDIEIKNVGVTGELKSNSTSSIIASYYNYDRSSKCLIENTYAITTLNNSGYDVGGLISLTYWINKPEIKNCYCAVKITDIQGRVGNFVGGGPINNNDNQHGWCTLKNAYYDKTLLPDKFTPSGTGLTTEEMKSASNYIGTNDDGSIAWDFKENDSDTDYTWYIDPNVNNGYPELHF